MKYLKLFKESSDDDFIDVSILLDIMNDLKDEYTTLDFKYSETYLQINRGNEIISETIINNSIKSALEYYYKETGVNIYAEIVKVHYDAFFAQNTSFKKRFINSKPSLHYKSADFVLYLRRHRVKLFDTNSILFSKTGIIHAKTLNDDKFLAEASINEDRQFERIDMSTISHVFDELINNYENIKIEYGTNFIKLVKEPLKNPFDKFDNEMLKKNIEFILSLALTTYFEITDLKVFYFISKNTLENFFNP